ncbi:MAG: response regulator [Anaerolineales bacterium]|jgi:DNA-binding response OmpR family regulator|uniref:response regulator n=1 Tax=Candidatus Villigracilis vicinus TaxID=3140679 RepID=UPI003135FA62|nr:response regulator [Anaerolineales bacterium]MBK9780094.1 response regulator [Anaerolineales bacterium]
MATGERILIVENDPDIADLIGRQSLQPLGFQVVVVGEAGAALKVAVQTPPDLILANINLPGLSGKDLLAALNSQNIKSPVIVIAEKGQEHDAIQAFRLGAMDVLFWPLRDAEVVSIVERALRQTQETRERQKLDRQLKATNEELQKRLRDMTTILSIAKAVTSVTDQRYLFDKILESALQLGESEMCWLMLREDKGNNYILRAQRGLPDAWSKKMNQPVDDGISSLVALSGESLFMNGTPMQKFKIAALGKAAGVVPIKIKNEVIGLMIVVRKADREFSRDAQTMLEAMADYASISLVNARLFRALEQTAESARTGEKTRHASLESLRKSIRTEVETAAYPLNLILTEMPGALNPEQKKALETVKSALQRLSHSSENTVTSPK